jgi:hypothetical protein
VTNIFRRPVEWSDLAVGDVVYTDNYEDGKYPNANPRVAGPFMVMDPKRRELSTLRWPGAGAYATFIHSSNSLIRVCIRRTS